MRLGSRDRTGPELLDDRLTWQNRAIGQLLGIAASDQRMPTGHTQVQIFHADSLRSSFLTIRGEHAVQELPALLQLALGFFHSFLLLGLIKTPYSERN